MPDLELPRDFPRDDLIRMVDLPAAEVEFRADQQSDGSIGVLEGYAAVFNQDTIIDSWEGNFIERIARGSFTKTINDRGHRIKILYEHGFDFTVGNKPLGRWDVLKERTRGLWVEVPLDDTSYNRDLVASLRSGAIDGMSFRFSVVREDWKLPDENSTDLPVRTIREVKLYELGPVTFPAYEATTAGVRGVEAFRAWQTARQTHPGAAPPGTPDPPGTPPIEAPAVNRKRLEQTLRRLRADFPELKETA